MRVRVRVRYRLRVRVRVRVRIDIGGTEPNIVRRRRLKTNEREGEVLRQLTMPTNPFGCNFLRE